MNLMSKKVSIAIIDSGVDDRIEKIKTCITAGFTISQVNFNNRIIEDHYEDVFGHGTNCADVILKNFSQVEFIPIKIVNNNGFSNSELLMEALKLCTKLPVKMICASLSVITKEYQKEKSLYEICQCLDAQNKIICVSEDNNNMLSVPAKFDNVIGVRAIYSKYLLQVKKNSPIQVNADGTPVFAVNGRGTYNLFKGSSKANADVVGKIAALLYHKPDSKRAEVLRALGNKYGNQLCGPRENTLNRIPSGKMQFKIARDLCCIINAMQHKGLDVIQLSQVPIMSPFTGVTYFNVYDLLEQVRNYYGGKRIFYEELNVDQICTLYNFVHYVQEELL